MSVGSFLQHFQVGGEDEGGPPWRRFCERADIYLAARTGDVERVRHLVERQGVDINKRDFWDSVPLYYACLCGHKDVVAYLLEHGAVCSENTFDGDRCLYGALTVEIGEMLMRADVSRVPPLKPLGQSIRRLSALCDDPEQPVGASHAFQPCCDLELMVGDKVYRVHKALMAARLSRFDEILSAQPTMDGVHRISLSEGSVPCSVVEALLVYVYSEKVELEMRHVEHLRKLAKHYGSPGLVKMTERELHSIKYYFKSLKKDSVPRKFILYPQSFPEEASLAHDLGKLYERSRQLDAQMRSGEEICVRNDYADGVVEVEDASFRVHLCVLCSRSDFFQQLVFSSEHGFEALPRRTCRLFGTSLTLLHVTDARSAAVQHILAYIYTDSMASLTEAELVDTELLSELFELADRFLIFGAKKAIAECCKNVDISFFQTCQLLMLADFYDVALLRDYCLETIAQELDEILDPQEPSAYRPCLEAFVADQAPQDFSDAESLFDSSATKGSFHGVLDGNSISGVGSNTLLEDLREKYLELYGWEGEERDDHAQDFDQRFLQFTLQALQNRQL